jgi:phosphate transport system protein
MSQSTPANPSVGHRPVFQAELDGIRSAIVDLTKQVEVAIERAVWGLRERNPDICTSVIEGDALINEQHHKIRDACFHVILTQAPVARDLRDIHGFDHMASELERMGDHCVSIARIGRSMTELPDVPSSEPLGALAEQAEAQVRDILAAFEARDTLAARDIARRDSVVDMKYRQIFSLYVDQMTADGSLAPRATGLVFVAHYLERIGDRVTNIAEELIFAETGGLEDLG